MTVHEPLCKNTYGQAGPASGHTPANGPYCEKLHGNVTCLRRDLGQNFPCSDLSEHHPPTEHMCCKRPQQNHRHNLISDSSADLLLQFPLCSEHFLEPFENESIPRESRRSKTFSELSTIADSSGISASYRYVVLHFSSLHLLLRRRGGCSR